MRTYYFDGKGDYVIRDFDLQQELTPGFLTVFICEVVDSIDFTGLVEVINVVIPGVVDDRKWILNSLSGCSSYQNVPLADWLEIRLRKEVFVFSKESFSLVRNLTDFCF